MSEKKFPVRPTEEVQDFNEIAPFLSRSDFDQQLVAHLNKLIFNKAWADRFKDSRSFKTLPVINHIPLVCKGEDCDFAAVCPILAAIKEYPNTAKSSIKALVGKPCKQDLIEASNLFIDLVNKLEVTPSDATDIMYVARLVRLHIMLRRIDWRITLDGMTPERITVVDVRTSNFYKEPTKHELFEEQYKIEKNMDAILKQLVASREAQIKAQASQAQIADQIRKAALAPSSSLKPVVIDVEVEKG